MLRKIAITFITAGICVFVLSMLVWGYKSRVTKESIDQLIRQQVPVGSTKEQIYEFLETRKI